MDHFGTWTIILTLTAFIACPLALGMTVGVLVRRLRGGRVGGAAVPTFLLVFPAAACTVLTIYYPLVGLWDGMLLGALLGAGTVLTLHRVFSDPRDILLTCGALLLMFGMLEAGSRIVYGPPPPSPAVGGPNLLLANSLKLSPPDSFLYHEEGMPHLLAANAMKGVDLSKRGEDTELLDRPPSAMLATELACSIIYGPAYHGLLDTRRERRVEFPDRFKPRPEAEWRVLHVGDSLVFGANVERDRTFAANLDRMNPRVQHINGGVSGMAPDEYLAVIQSWVARHKIDLAVMYLFEGNDINGLDSAHPCSGWKSLLTYQMGVASLRYPSAPFNDTGISPKWLFHNSPVPYPLRVLIEWHSAGALHLAGMLATLTTYDISEPQGLRFSHLEAIVRTARNELSAKGIRFAVVILPHEMTDQYCLPGNCFTELVLGITDKLRVPVFNAGVPLKAAMAAGMHPYQGDHSHFTDEGHVLIADALRKWFESRLEMPAR